MTRKMSAAEAKRSPLNLRTTGDLRARLEAAAAENGRSITQEVERRLEQSFDDAAKKADDSLPGVFSEEVRQGLNSFPAFAHFTATAADVVLHSIRGANGRGRSEIDVRTAARAALVAVADEFLWRGEDKPSPIEGPQAPLGVRVLDYPPAALGWEIAQQRINWLSTWRDGDAAQDKAEGRIRNLYSGDGRTVLMGPTVEEEEARRQSALAEAKAALARGDVEYEDPAKLHLYKRNDRS